MLKPGHFQSKRQTMKSKPNLGHPLPISYRGGGEKIKTKTSNAAREVMLLSLGILGRKMRGAPESLLILQSLMENGNSVLRTPKTGILFIENTENGNRATRNERE